MNEEKAQAEAVTVAEKLPAQQRAEMLAREQSVFFNVALWEHAQRVAQMFATSTMVPEHFRGNVGNCMIGLNYAHRLHADAFMVLQSLYIVHGRPGVEAKLVTAQVNASGKYRDPIAYLWSDDKGQEVAPEEVYNHPDRTEWGCRAYTVEAKSGKRVQGPKITWKIVKGEGWYDRKDRNGAFISKWRTIPEIMFMYRSVSWFANHHCPEMKLGMPTADEAEDMTISLAPSRNGVYREPAKIKPADPVPAGGGQESPETFISGEDYLREQLFSKVPEGDQNALAEFIEQTCTANRASVGDVVDQATRNLDGFLKAFQTWRAKRAGNGDNPEAKLVAEFNNLRTPGLREYLLSRSAEIPTFPGAVKAALERKCRAVLNMTLVEALAQVGSPVREPQTGAVLGNGPKKPCPDLDGDEVYESTCAECEGREGCPSWEV